MQEPVVEIVPSVPAAAESATSDPDDDGWPGVPDSPAYAPLPSAALTIPLMPARAGRQDGWASVGGAALALGLRFGHVGTATGEAARRGGVAIGGFFSGAGRAVADSF
jgi:hypothetical protein